MSVPRATTAVAGVSLLIGGLGSMILMLVTLDCAGVLTDWARITDDYEWTYVEPTRANPLPDVPGRHVHG